ncbi:MAG: response regulator transcription factor [Paludibacter sp.]|uniref:DNA-binding response regulator, NarL/FixJ family, contains REC and HTH domains n=1 Tax=Flavobacterium frigoris TaxID=229204 RepID=A0A1H9FW70_FLAFI|nr:response regulator transcription factor [Flavobacterium frigoris]NDP23073.1 response regulator transcription factor [Paludibacter sp.]SEQ42141.1 DNA-binding response regulator, NarL/FixJ family, contains REC and HTH domains [Flavobacterium frigoris]
MITSNVFLVDDHPMTVDSYRSLISQIKTKATDDNFVTAFSCEQAYNRIIEKHNDQENFDVALVDISLPAYPAKNLLTGIDVAKLIRNYFPACKIILLTMHSEPAIVTTAKHEVNPEGFILKSDIDATSFVTAYQSITLGATFYSDTISKTQNNTIIKKLNFDAIDLQILVLIDKKIKTKDMPNHIDLSLSAIEKRKACIKNTLLKEKSSNKELIVEAKKLRLT